MSTRYTRASHREPRHLRWHGAALTASLLTALAALFVFLAARGEGFVQPVPAVLIALAFSLGSCAWPVSSQALWQHPASTFLLSLAAWLLLRSEGRPLAAAWCGAAFGMAVLCRPTVAVVVVCTGAYLLCVDRRRCAAFVLGGLPFLVLPSGRAWLRAASRFRRRGPPTCGRAPGGRVCPACCSARHGAWSGSRPCWCSAWSARRPCGETRASEP